MAKSSEEVVYEGWLTKSPPTKRVWRARWRRRWFSLKHSGEIPNQFILTYYSDRKCRNEKGYINLDDCEQVDLGLKVDERKLKFDHVFDIKTPTRTYYLAADTEDEMKLWVKYICKVCSLKCSSEEELHNGPADVDFCEEEDKGEKRTSVHNETPPISPVSTSPYIPISECITGSKPLRNPQDFNTLLYLKNSVKSDFNETHSNQSYGIAQRNYINYVNDMQDPRFYDSPRMLAPVPNKIETTTDPDNNKKDKNSSPLQSPTDTESVFTDDDTGDIDVFVTQKFTKKDANGRNVSEGRPPPPRPPKTVNVAPNWYINLNMQSPTGKNEQDSSDDKEHGKAGQDAQKIVTDDMYDFPRSHQVEGDSRNTTQRRHCYNNAAPVATADGQIFRYDISPKPSTSTNQIFKYDLEDLPDEPASPLSQTSSTAGGYSNLPSPLLTDSQMMPPPIVNRDLKPRRKLSDSLSLCSNPEPSSPLNAPSVDRKLKPPTPLQDMRKNFSDDSRKVMTGPSPVLSQARKFLGVEEGKSWAGLSPTFGHARRDGDEEVRRIRAAPSPTPPGLTRSHESLLSQNEEIYHYLPGKMQYLDLDLDCGTSNFTKSGANTMPSKPAGANNTVYKKVDFMATKAFNITRNNLEQERKEPVTFSKK